MSTTAEGIETENQADILRSLGCPLGQGYLFGKPMPAEDFEHLLLDALITP
jgi:EAL domain-containing protein (putative c-di-GMP-specific phosphodiesterase class I)